MGPVRQDYIIGNMELVKMELVNPLTPELYLTTNIFKMIFGNALNSSGAVVISHFTLYMIIRNVFRKAEEFFMIVIWIFVMFYIILFVSDNTLNVV